MSLQDQGRIVHSSSHAWHLGQVFCWLLKDVSFDSIALRQDCTWTVRSLIYAAVLWAWSDEKTLIDRFSVARKIIMYMFGVQQQPAESYQAFVKLLRKWTGPLMDLLKPAFRRRMVKSMSGVWKVAGWTLFACDGSRVDVPRTRKNEERYSPKSKLSRKSQKRRRSAKRLRSRKAALERRANVPRIWLTVLWHVGSGLLWDWRAGPSESSERAHLEEMLPRLPQRSLITADAGFVGYDLWKTILESGHQLLVRVGGNVRLLRKLGYARENAGLVYLWPDKAAKKRLPPLVLRIVITTAKGRLPIYLVTSVMSRRVLSDVQVAEIYRRRWGIEVYYRHCKQTYERRKLRSQNPDNAMLELHWSLLGMWAMGLHSHRHLVRRGVPPEKISFAGVLRAYRRPMREYKSRPDPGESLGDLLNRAIIDPYKRKNKSSRDYPLKKHDHPAGPPIILNATRSQVLLASQLKIEYQKRLTA